VRLCEADAKNEKMQSTQGAVAVAVVVAVTAMLSGLLSELVGNDARPDDAAVIQAGSAKDLSLSVCQLACWLVCPLSMT
jgi:hypothetical protein